MFVVRALVISQSNGQGVNAFLEMKTANAFRFAVYWWSGVANIHI